MFDKIKRELPSVNLLSNGTSLIGDIDVDGDFRFDGELKGNIKCNGKLIIGASAYINGELNASEAEISGTVNGTILVSELTTFKTSAKFTGILKTNKLQVENGASVSMSCDMETQILEKTNDLNKN